MNPGESPFPSAPDEDNQEESVVTSEEIEAIYRKVGSGIPSSEEDRALRKKFKEQEERKKQRWCMEHGIVQQVLIDYVCRTTPDHVENIIHLAFDRLGHEKPDLADYFYLENSSSGLTRVLNLSYSGLKYGGEMGKIIVTPLNDIEARIEVICEGKLILIMDWDESAELCRMALRVLEILAYELSQLFDIPIKIPTNPSLPHSDPLKSIQGIISEDQISGDTVEPIWEKIPAKGSDRDIVRLWCNGMTIVEIGRRLHLEKSTVNTRVHQLRKKFPHLSIPYHGKKKKIK